MTEKKLTKVVAFTQIKELLEQVGANEELVEVMAHEIELVNKKNASRAKTQSKNQKANEELKAQILNIMDDETQYRVSEIYELLPILKDKGFTINKANSLMTQLKNEQKVIRTEVKGTAYFTKA